jgi:hypothetical protein
MGDGLIIGEGVLTLQVRHRDCDVRPIEVRVEGDGAYRAGNGLREAAIQALGGASRRELGNALGTLFYHGDEIKRDLPPIDRDEVAPDVYDGDHPLTVERVREADEPYVNVGVSHNDPLYFRVEGAPDQVDVEAVASVMHESDCRRLASELLDAADWMEKAGVTP